MNFPYQPTLLDSLSELLYHFFQIRCHEMKLATFVLSISSCLQFISRFCLVLIKQSLTIEKIERDNISKL